MKRNILILAVAALAALMVNIKAEDISFERLSAGVGEIRAESSNIPDPFPAAAEISKTTPAAPPEWLILIFINGVNNLGIAGFADKNINAMEKIGSTDKVAVVTEFRTLGRDPDSFNITFPRASNTILIQKDDLPSIITSELIASNNDKDMGSADHFVRFARRNIRKFPGAKKVAIILWNHGGGRAGIAWDDVSGHHMEVDQLGQALSKIKGELKHKIDIFATDACLMQMAEVVYELKDSVSVIVGSEELIPGDGYPYDKILAPLVANPGMSDEALGKLIVDAYGTHYSATNTATLSALRTSALPGFLSLLNNWVQAVTADAEAFKAATAERMVNRIYDFPHDERSAKRQDSKDLYDYLSNVGRSLPDGTAAVTAGSALKEYIANDLIIRKTAMAPKAHGLAIHIPDLQYESGNYQKFAFTKDSEWARFIKLITEERLK
ncbi:MAG: clostripain-related cysteine peptidase [Elusimicrobiota bacterium]